jgi:hypothetical protein
MGGARVGEGCSLVVGVSTVVLAKAAKEFYEVDGEVELGPVHGPIRWV